MKMLRIELDNEFEADVFSDLLENENIPNVVISHRSLAYNGLFQITTGWGHVEIPEAFHEKASELLQNYRASQNE